MLPWLLHYTIRVIQFQSCFGRMCWSGLGSRSHGPLVNHLLLLPWIDPVLAYAWKKREMRHLGSRTPEVIYWLVMCVGVHSFPDICIFWFFRIFWVILFFIFFMCVFMLEFAFMLLYKRIAPYSWVTLFSYTFFIFFFLHEKYLVLYFYH